MRPNDTGRLANATALIWRVLMVAEKRFRRLNAPHLMADVYGGECPSGYENGSPIAQRKKIAFGLQRMVPAFNLAVALSCLHTI